MGFRCRYSLKHLVDVCGRKPLCFGMKYCKGVRYEKDGSLEPKAHPDERKRGAKDPQGRDFRIRVQLCSKLEGKIPTLSVNQSIPYE